MDQEHKINRFLSNLNYDGLYQLADRLLMHPEDRKFILKAVEEFDKAFELKE